MATFRFELSHTTYDLLRVLNAVPGVTVRDRTVSLLALGSGARISLRGTRWTLRRRALKPGSLGLSNVTGKALDLIVHSGVVAVVFPTAARRRT